MGIEEAMSIQVEAGKEDNMYLGFDFLVFHNGKYFIHPNGMQTSQSPITDTVYCINTEQYPDQFEKDVDGEMNPKGVMNKFYEGALNFPRWSFSPEKYDQGQNPFERFFPDNNIWCRRALRRIWINRTISCHFNYQSELKYLRKMIKHICNCLPLPLDSVIDEFLAYNTTVENLIGTCPKDTPETEKKADKVNGKGDPFWFPPM